MNAGDLPGAGALETESAFPCDVSRLPGPIFSTACSSLLSNVLMDRIPVSSRGGILVVILVAARRAARCFTDSGTYPTSGHELVASCGLGNSAVGVCVDSGIQADGPADGFLDSGVVGSTGTMGNRSVFKTSRISTFDSCIGTIAIPVAPTNCGTSRSSRTRFGSDGANVVGAFDSVNDGTIRPLSVQMPAGAFGPLDQSFGLAALTVSVTEGGNGRYQYQVLAVPTISTNQPSTRGWRPGSTSEDSIGTGSRSSRFFLRAIDGDGFCSVVVGLFSATSLRNEKFGRSSSIQVLDHSDNWIASSDGLSLLQQNLTTSNCSDCKDQSPETCG